MLDPATIDRFAHGFFGYGNLQAPFWFIGMEEGGLRHLDEFERRVEVWVELGRTPLVDLFEFSRELGPTPWFEPNAPLQRTWRALIRAVLIATDANTSMDAQRWYQANRLGRSDGETALLELMPFPSATTREWPYANLGIESCATRDNYGRAMSEPRLASIINLVQTHQPRAVVCYGNANFWQKRLSLQLSETGLSTGTTGETLVIAAPHPTAPGSTNDRWDRIGGLLGEQA